MPSAPLLPVYRRAPVTMVRGEGMYLIDDAGRRYLDFASGIAVNGLGHCHPKVMMALVEQSAKLWHCSNLFYTDVLERFSTRLVDACFADTVFFCSSGTEAVETAIKMARRYHFANGHKERFRIIAAQGAFHGRSTGALAACSSEKAREGFGPLMPGFEHVAFNDLAALEKAITRETAAILLETIQGEGGIREHSPEYLQVVRQIADEHGILLILDEIQCGYGRTGSLFSFEECGIVPDIVTTAKGIGNGFPLAAVLSNHKAASGMKQGTHGSTYGSNPLAMAVGEAVLNELLADGFFAQVRKNGVRLKAELIALMYDFPHLITEIRGRGLMLGIELANPHMKYPLADALRSRGLLVAPAVSNVLRILPPLVIEEQHIREAAEILRHVAANWKETA